MEVKVLVIQSLRDAYSHLTGGAVSLQVFISFTPALTFLTDGSYMQRMVLFISSK